LTLFFLKPDELFKKVYATLEPAGVFMTHQDGIADERRKPVYHVTEFPGPEIMGMDFSFAQGIMADTMLRAGFQSVRRFTIQSDIADMDIDIGRKK
jgi:hypothetical protein